MGTMRERQPGVWELRTFLGRDDSGRPRQISRTFRGGKRAAIKALAELDVEAAAGKHGRAGEKGTVNDLLDLHFANLDRKGLSPKTIDNYRNYATNIIRPAVGAKPVRKLTALDLDRLYQQLGDQGKRPATIRMVHAILSGALGQALKWGMVTNNVARAASPPPVRKARIRVPTAAQVRAILAAADKRDPILGRMLMLAALTGARRGEVCALRWCDIDTTAGTLTIAHSILDLPGRLEIKDTKSHAVRVLALDPAAIAILDLHRADVERMAALGETQVRPAGFVFSTGSLDGSAVVRPDWLTSFFNRVRDGLGPGYEGLTLHGLRHFVATQLAARGDVSARTLAGRLGHADASVTLRVYAEFFPAADLQAAAHMGRILTQ
jgi:integrase